MKKISFIITSLVRGGAETVTFRLATYYAERGYDVEIVMLLDNIIEFDVPKSIKVIDFSGKTASRIRRIPYWLRNLKKYFKNRKPDVVISFIARINILTLLSVKNNAKKVIISERNDPRYDSRNKTTWFFINRCYTKADHIVFQTQQAKHLFKRSIQEKGVVISNPIKITTFADENSYDKNLVLYAGRMSEQKNVETIIDAAKIVNTCNQNIQFELYGDGPLKEVLKERIKSKNLESNVHIYDNIPNIIEKMRKAKLFVMSSLYEGMSNALLEASYSGVPCLTTPVLGSDIIKDGENGYFFNFKHSKQLAEIITRVFSDEEGYKNLRHNAIEMAKQHKQTNLFEEWSNLIE